MSVELHVGRWEGVTLGTVVEAAELGSAVALLYAFDRCTLARVEGGALHEPGGPAELTGVYEARVFSEAGEVRWVRRGLAGLGTAVWVGEEPPPEPFEEVVELPAVVAVRDTQYLLWGRATDVEPAPGWSEVAAAQVGAVAVPGPKPPGKDVAFLRAREYVGEDEHGNAAVVEQVLTGIGWEPGGQR